MRPSPSDQPLPLAARLLIPAVLVLFGTLSGLLAMEGVLRLTWTPPGAEGMYCQDKVLGRKLCPNWEGTIETPEYRYSIRTNTFGMRSPQPEKTDTPRLLGLGDSFAFGQGVQQEETFYAILHDRLATSFPDAVVYNGACPSWGPPQQVEVVSRSLKSIRPDLVIVAFYSGNDLFDTLLYRDPSSAVVRETLIQDQPFSETFSWFQRLWISRYFETSVVPRLPSALGTLFLSAHDRALGASPTTQSEWKLFSKEKNETIERGWKEVQTEFKRLKSLTKQSGSQLLAVYIPTDAEVRPQRWQILLERSKKNAEALDDSLPRTRFSKLCHALDIPMVDPSEVLRTSSTEPYYRLDRHLNAEGHRIVGEQIYKYLTSDSWLSRP